MISVEGRPKESGRLFAGVLQKTFQATICLQCFQKRNYFLLHEYFICSANEHKDTDEGLMTWCVLLYRKQNLSNMSEYQNFVKLISDTHHKFPFSDKL